MLKIKALEERLERLQGGLTESGLQIDEAYAQQNEVWVVSINEKVDQEGEVKAEYGEGRAKGETYPNARFQRMRVGWYLNGTPPSKAVYGVFADHHLSIFRNFRMPKLPKIIPLFRGSKISQVKRKR